MIVNRTPWQKAGRWVTPLIVIAFLLPFFGVSCNGMDVVHVSGTDLVVGGEPGGMIAELGKQTTQDMESGAVVADDLSVDPEPLAIAALAIALALVGISWIRTSRFAVIAALVFGIAGVGALGGLYVTMKGEVDDNKTEQQPAGAGSGSGSGTGSGDEAMSAEARELSAEIQKEIHIEFGARAGFWLACAGFVTVAALAGASLRRRPDAAA